MKKLTFIFISSVFVIVLIIQCGKKEFSNTPPTNATSILQATIFGTTFNATNQIKVANDSALFSSNFNPSISIYGNFINYTFTDSVVKPYIHKYILEQSNIFIPGDTVRYIINLSSITPITTGITYNLFGRKNSPTTPGNAYGIALYARTSPNFKDSTATGTLTFSTLNTATKMASGTFSFTNIGFKGSIPDTVPITGQFTNLPLQEF